MNSSIRLVRSGVHACLVLAPAIILGGCTGIGPKTVARDRYDYSTSITESWKRQTLLNIVKLRYMDPPIFVDVGQIVAGYSLETGVTLGGSFPETNSFGGTSGTIGGSGRFTDRPTITYIPLTGDKFLRALMTPLPPDAVFFMMQSGYAADALFLSTISVMNGLKNQGVSLNGVAAADPRFLRAVELLRKIQLSEAVGLRVLQDAKNQRTSVITFRSKDIGEETLAEVRELRQLLGMSQEGTEFQLVFGGVAANDRELAVLTRSLLSIMQIMAAQVEVPPEHVAEGRASPGIAPEAINTAEMRLVRIQCSKDKPDDAYVVVSYHGQWFWIDDRDIRTKRAFAMIMLLFTLADTGSKEALPLITIPAQ
jgi:hypothetical protein